MLTKDLNIRAMIAVMVIVSFVGLVTLWMIRPPSGEASQLTMLNALIMVLGTALLTVINYLFGSSKGSSDKDETIAKAVSVPPATPAQNPPPPIPASA